MCIHPYVGLCQLSLQAYVGIKLVQLCNKHRYKEVYLMHCPLGALVTIVGHAPV